MNTDFARGQMINQQVRAWQVFDANVLKWLEEVPRELFVPRQFAALAFADTEIPMGHGQMMMTPTIQGRVLQALQLTGDEKVLEIGTGNGFLTACLARLSAHVTSIDIYDEFLEQSQKRLAACDIDNVELINMNAMSELPDRRFDAIAITGSVKVLDARFRAALNPGGRMFVVVGDAPAMSATRETHIDADNWQSDTLFETDLLPLVNGALPAQFSF